MARWRKVRLRWAIAGGLVIALVVAAVLGWPYVQRYTGSAPPSQFYDRVQLEPALAPDYPRVLGVAHNAGNNPGTLSTALHYGADVIEIGVPFALTFTGTSGLLVQSVPLTLTLK